MSLNDKRYNFYLTAGTTLASLNEMELEWLKDNGATADSLMDCRKQFLELQGYAYGTYNDSFFNYLRGLGYTGALNDMLNNYYTVTPPAGGAFTNEFTAEFN